MHCGGGGEPHKAESVEEKIFCMEVPYFNTILKYKIKDPYFKHQP